MRSEPGFVWLIAQLTFKPDVDASASPNHCTVVYKVKVTELPPPQKTCFHRVPTIAIVVYLEERQLQIENLCRVYPQYPHEIECTTDNTQVLFACSIMTPRLTLDHIYNCGPVRS